MTTLGKIGSTSVPTFTPQIETRESTIPNDHLQTLDEPISETIMRDVRMVALKLKHVLIPKGSVQELRNWDLWGPLILCLTLATSLSISAATDQSVTVFASVFVIVWCGAGVVTLNAALLGGRISFLQSVCVLGYCIAPLSIVSIFCHIFHTIIVQLVAVSIGLIWSTRASVGFMAQLCDGDRKALAIYPVLLFYVTIGWMILVQ